MKRPRSRKHSAGTALAMLVATCVVITACGDTKRSLPADDNEQSASVNISIDAPFKLLPEPVNFDSSLSKVWFQHTLTVENTSDRRISISGDVSPQFIGEDKMLILGDQCAPNPPAPGGKLPTTACTGQLFLAIDVEPRTSAKFGTVYVFKDLEGMPALTPGEYIANASVTWKSADESENHTTMAKITYSVK